MTFIDRATVEGSLPRGGDLVRRHRLSTRIWHWVNVVTLLRHADERADDLQRPSAALLGRVRRQCRSGLARDRQRRRRRASCGSARCRSNHRVLGARTVDGQIQTAPFPAGRRSHPTTASRRRGAGTCLRLAAWRSAAGYLGLSLVNRHIRRDLCAAPREMAAAHIWHDIKDHARLRFPTGEAALRYNVLQKLAYARRALRAAAAGDPDRPDHVAGDGRGLALAARPVRRAAVGAVDPLHRRLRLLVAFVVVHLVMVVLAGPINEIRSMITGWYRLPRGERP